MNRSLVFATVLALSAPFASHAAASPVPVTASAAAEKFEIGAMLVERYGSHGSPMIFIPGLSSGPTCGKTWCVNSAKTM